ncbi:MAG: DNA mismatch repair endonuclease MutL, partial [candidate division NC10 bacterium]|nr:DNA mismatch repair endonuclease MutL [candidate division NC10 bacterium]
MKIHILPVEIRQKIAAGEVVERPASVVKELIENTLDAEAETIQVEVQEAGRRLVKVTDDGVGMSPQDVPLAFERFATSKVFEEGDIYAVKTFGFRGEALPSIAAVSRVRLVTRERGALYGTEAKVEGGRLVSLQQVGAPVGTTVEVFDLFFNTPARRKFLRSFRTEYGHLIGAFTKFALAFPEKRFTLVSEGREVYALQPGSFQDRMRALFGQETLATMEEFSAEGSSGRLWGSFVPGQGEKKRSYFFVNRRAVKSAALSRALRDHLKEPGMVLLFLEVPPSFVDVNIHPAKAEVRFQQEEAIYVLVRQGLARRASGWKVEGVAEKVEAYQAAESRFVLLGQLEETFLLAFS